MKKNLMWASLLLASLVQAHPGHAATISWKLPSSYADGTPIDPEDVRRIVVQVYAGPADTGPWKWVATSSPGASSVMVMDPSVGQTLWYTAKSNLDGSESVYADPVKKINLDIQILPFLKKVANKMFTLKKMISLLVLSLLAGLVWLIQSRRRKGKG